MPPSNYGPLPQLDSEGHPTSAHASTDVLSSTPIRPAIYYGDGPFDPPSSDSDESEVLLEKPLTPGAAERAEYPTLGEEDEGLADSGLFLGGRRKQVLLIHKYHSNFCSLLF
jgi:dipeptidyl aminopeptidase B